MGHAIGDLLGFDNDADYVQHYQRLYRAQKLSKYQGQGGLNGKAGRQETLTESITEVLHSGVDAARKKYDEQYVDWILKKVIQ